MYLNAQQITWRATESVSLWIHPTSHVSITADGNTFLLLYFHLAFFLCLQKHLCSGATAKLGSVLCQWSQRKGLSLLWVTAFCRGWKKLPSSQRHSIYPRGNVYCSTRKRLSKITQFTPNIPHKNKQAPNTQACIHPAMGFACWWKHLLNKTTYWKDTG